MFLALFAVAVMQLRRLVANDGWTVKGGRVEVLLQPPGGVFDAALLRSRIQGA